MCTLLGMESKLDENMFYLYNVKIEPLTPPLYLQPVTAITNREYYFQTSFVIVRQKAKFKLDFGRD